MKIPIYFNSVEISKLPVYPGLSIDWEIMGPREIKAVIELPGALMCPIGSYIIYREQRYTVNTEPSVTTGGKYNFQYTIIFESDQYRLYDKKLKHLKNKTFQYYGGLSDYAQLIVDNINEIDFGWSVGACDTVPEKTISFDGHTCRTALDTIAEAFTVEWSVNEKVIGFVKQVGSVTTHVFEVGRGKGLYSLGFEYQNDKNIVTRAFGYGSTRNLPEGYRGGKVTQLMFDGLYVEQNDDLYRVKEGDYVSEDIYPKLEGAVSAVSVYNPDSGIFTIKDTSLTFNLKEHFSSETPKISFLTGELQGQEFDILDYNNTTKTISIKVFVDGNNNTLPNSTFQAHIGDTYTLFDMFLPEEAVTAAEDALKAETLEWLAENCIPQVLFSLTLDPLYARDNNIMLQPGDKVTVKNEALGINNLIRVTSVSYPINFPDIITPDTAITAQIANFIPYTLTERVISDTIDNQHEIKIVNRTNAEKARLNALNLSKLQGRIFNPDGSLFTGPESLVAGMATFGYDSQNFNLNDVTISPNDGADPNKLVISGGELVHRIYKIEGLGYTWIISPHAWAGLNPAKFYYVYAKCSKSALVGTWEISETPVNANDIVGYYAFNLGILYEVNTYGYRDFEFTKGMTYIVGDQITTGTIKDLTGQNFFDLNAGQFNLGDANSGMDWDITTPATLTIRGAVASKVIQVGSGGIINAGISGVTDAGTSSLRFWAGADLAHKDDAPFKVLDDGSIIATKGKIGNFTIDSEGLKNTENKDAYIYQQKTLPDGNILRAAIGTNINVFGYIGDFENTQDTGNPNKGVRISVKNGEWGIPLQEAFSGNQALEIEGDFSISGGEIVVDAGTYDYKRGWTGSFTYDRDGDVGRITVVKGIIVNQEKL